MFRDVPECSSMFRNVPCSGFYRRPFPSAKLKMAVAAVKVIWAPSDDKTGESEVGANSNINALLTCLLFEFCETLLDFSEQDFILETVMRSYSRRLDFFELNPYVDLRQRTKLTIHPQ